MSRLKKIKNQMHVTNKIAHISESMLLSSKMKLNSYKYRMHLFEKQVEILGNIVFQNLSTSSDDIFYSDFLINSGFFNKEVRFFVFSDLGFCGQYNNNVLEAYADCDCSRIVFGKKGQELREFIGKADLMCNFNLSGKNLNLSITIIDAEKGKMDIVRLGDFIKPCKNHSLMEKPKNVFGRITESFFNYAYYASKYNETLYRVKTMTNAVDNANEEMKKLKISFGKERQSIITQEIALIASNVGEEI